MAAQILLADSRIFPPGTNVSVYALSDVPYEQITNNDTLTISATAADSSEVNVYKKVELSLEPAANYLLVGTVNGKRRATIVTIPTGEGADTALSDEVQIITETATGGTFTVAFEGDESGNLAVGISDADLQTALEALDGIDAGDVTVVESPAGTYTITFGGKYEGSVVPEIVVDDALATGGTVTIATSVQGGA